LKKNRDDGEIVFFKPNICIYDTFGAVFLEIILDIFLLTSISISSKFIDVLFFFLFFGIEIELFFYPHLKGDTLSEKCYISSTSVYKYLPIIFKSYNIRFCVILTMYVFLFNNLFLAGTTDWSYPECRPFKKINL